MLDRGDTRRLIESQRTLDGLERGRLTMAEPQRHAVRVGLHLHAGQPDGAGGAHDVLLRLVRPRSGGHVSSREIDEQLTRLRGRHAVVSGGRDP